MSSCMGQYLAREDPEKQKDDIVQIDDQDKQLKIQMIDEHNVKNFALICQRITEYIRIKYKDGKDLSKEWNKWMMKFIECDRTLQFKSFKEWITVEILNKINTYNFIDSLEWMGIMHCCKKAQCYLTDEILCDRIKKKSLIMNSHIINISNQIKIATKQIEIKMNLPLSENANHGEIKRAMDEILDTVGKLIDDNFKQIIELHRKWEEFF